MTIYLENKYLDKHSKLIKKGKWTVLVEVTLYNNIKIIEAMDLPWTIEVALKYKVQDVYTPSSKETFDKAYKEALTFIESINNK